MVKEGPTEVKSSLLVSYQQKGKHVFSDERTVKSGRLRCPLSLTVASHVQTLVSTLMIV